MNKSRDEASMDDKKSLRFTEEEKTVLFSLFGKYKDVIDIRHRRNSQSQHKQIALRKCWDSILDSFNAHPDTSKRSMKQIQKFWLNSKLRKRLPDDKDDCKSPEKRQKIVEVKLSPSKKSNDAAYQALVKTCKDSENENENDDDDNSDRKIALDSTDEIALSETNVANGEQYEEEQYDPLTDSYFQNEAITLKVINDQIDLALAAPAPSSIVTIPAQTQRGTTMVIPATNYETHVRKQEVSPSSSATAPTTAYITYSPSSTATIGNQNIQLVKSANGNYLITTPAASTPQQVIRGSRINQSSPITTSSAILKDNENASIQDMQRQEQLLRLREVKLRCEVQEIEKEKTREELLQMREIHRMKIKEMEMRLRNMERS